MSKGIGKVLGGAVLGFALGVLTFGFGSAALLTAGAFAAQGLLRPKIPGGLQQRDILIRSGAAPQVRVYGEAAVGGVVLYANQRPIAGNDNYELWLAIAHAGHECEDITDIWYEGDRLESGVQITWSAGSATVDSGRWHADDATHEAATIWKVLGTTTQVWPTELTGAFSELGANHQARGWACTFHRLQLFDESESVFAGGEPANIRAVVRGAKVYDTALDSSPGTSPDAGGNQTWSTNPVLCAVDYMRKVWGFANDRFDWDWIDQERDKCAALVDIPPSASPANQEARYACNVVLSLGDDHDANVDKILASCLGFRSVVNGKIRITVGGAFASTVSLDETDIIGPIKRRISLPRADRYNQVEGTYVSSENWIETEFFAQKDAAFVTRDNGETIVRNIRLDAVTSEYQAQRIARFHLRQSDAQEVVEVPLRWSGLRLTPGTYCSLSYDKFGYSSKLFRCESLAINERGVPVLATLREDAAANWTDPTVGAYTTRNPQGQIVLPANPTPPTLEGDIAGHVDLAGLVRNGGMFIQDTQRDRPAYWYQGGSTTAAGLGYADADKSIMTIDDPANVDTNISAYTSLIAIQANLKVRYRIKVRMRAVQKSGSGRTATIHLLERSTDLPETAAFMTRLAGPGFGGASPSYDSPYAQGRNFDATLTGDDVTAIEVPTTWTDYEMFYTPTAGVKWVGFEIENDDAVMMQLQIDRLQMEPDFQSLDFDNDLAVGKTFGDIAALSNGFLNAVRRHPVGDHAVPAHWYTGTVSGDDVSTHIYMDSATAPDKVNMEQSSTNDLYLISSAWQPRPGVIYEFALRARSASGVSSDAGAMILQVHYRTSDMPAGKIAMIDFTGLVLEDEVANDIANISISGNVISQTLTTSFQVFTGQWEAPSNVEWASVILWVASDDNHAEIDWCVVRDFATRNVTLVTSEVDDLNDNADSFPITETFTVNVDTTNPLRIHANVFVGCVAATAPDPDVWSAEIKHASVVRSRTEFLASDGGGVLSKYGAGFSIEWIDPAPSIGNNTYTLEIDDSPSTGTISGVSGDVYWQAYEDDNQ